MDSFRGLGPLGANKTGFNQVTNMHLKDCELLERVKKSLKPLPNLLEDTKRMEDLISSLISELLKKKKQKNTLNNRIM